MPIAVTEQIPSTDKRDAILAAALRVIPRLGLHNAPISAIAREAGVAVGTLYLYFGGKEEMINALYLHVMAERNEVTLGTSDERAERDDSDDGWARWSALARWHLEHQDAANLILQCRASGILSDATRRAEQRMEQPGLALLHDAVAQGVVRDLPRHVLWALYMGPIAMLAQMRDTEAVRIDETLLRATFDGVRRALSPA